LGPTGKQFLAKGKTLGPPWYRPYISYTPDSGQQLTHSVIIELESLTLLIPKATAEYDTEPVPSTSFCQSPVSWDL